MIQDDEGEYYVYDSSSSPSSSDSESGGYTESNCFHSIRDLSVSHIQWLVFANDESEEHESRPHLSSEWLGLFHILMLIA